VALELSTPLLISDTVMRRAMTKRSKKETSATMVRRMRFGQDGRVAVAVIVHLGGAAGRGREGDWRAAVVIEAESGGKVPERPFLRAGGAAGC
jgi:hypothetical protein